MTKTIVKINKRFIRFFLQTCDFLENRFVIIPVKGVVELFNKMLERVYGRSWKCVTQFHDACFECENEQPESIILIVNSVFSAEFKKESGVVKNMFQYNNKISLTWKSWHKES